jgi:hypothetical protein
MTVNPALSEHIARQSLPPLYLKYSRHLWQSQIPWKHISDFVTDWNLMHANSESGPRYVGLANFNISILLTL